MLNFRKSALLRFVARRRSLNTHTPGHIDEYGFGGQTLRKADLDSDALRGEPYFVGGWAIDLGRRQTPWDISVEIDGKEVPARKRLSLPRPDVVALFRTPDVLLSGFNAAVDTQPLAVGPHDLTIRVIVGRYGTAFARIPDAKRFYVYNQLSAGLAPPPSIVSNLGAYHLGPIPIVARGSVLELRGWGRDDRGRPFASVAAQIDDSHWNEGWSGLRHRDVAQPEDAAAAFHVRIRLDIPAGQHQLRLAGRTNDGKWRALGEPRQLLVTYPSEPLSQWARPLADGGAATITGANGSVLTRIEVFRIEAVPVVFKGLLRRSTPVGKSVGLVAKSRDGGESSLPSWSAPTVDPNVMLFGGEIGPLALPPGTYRLFVDAPDASLRCIGRADTGCGLVVQRAEAQRQRRHQVLQGAP